MLNKKNIPDKRYYSISEVASIFDVSKSLIRYWETEFAFLKPYKNSKGERRFTKENLQQFETIYRLLKDKGYTIKGAKQQLENNKDWFSKKEKAVTSLLKIKELLEEMKLRI